VERNCLHCCTIHCALGASIITLHNCSAKQGKAEARQPVIIFMIVDPATATAHAHKHTPASYGREIGGLVRAGYEVF